ncbi:MAG: hypothetical protein ACYDH3_11340 [Candidatus Aminicenantales bacterium]
MVFNQVMTHGLIFGAISTVYLLVMMIVFSPRVWGYSDYPDAIKRKVPVQTRKEKTLAIIISVPWLAFVLAFPVFSTLALKAKLGGEIPILTAFLNLMALFIFVTIGDLVILDWLIVSRITPKFVIIPGTTREDYKDFSHHYIGHAKAAVILVPAFLLIAVAITFL